MQIGIRIIYNKLNGKPIIVYGESEGDITEREPLDLDYIDLPFGDTTLQNVASFHIENGSIVIDQYIQDTLTEEERLRQENEELENQLLLATDSQVGGIL